MDRRQFLLSGSTATAGLLAARQATAGAWNQSANASKFHLQYAPHFGMFRASAGNSELDQLRFAADQGFRAWEDNGMLDRSVELQNNIARTMQNLEMRMGVISATRGMSNIVNFAGDDPAPRQQILERLKKVVEVAKRVHATWTTVVLGNADPKLPHEYQMANCVELLKRCCDIMEPHGLVMVLEPLNRITNHPGKFLYGSPQAYLICKAVARPSCKILFDIYHQQITEGNLIANIDRCWDEIPYFQCGDNPGRKEPGTGEINYRKLFQHLYRKGYQGIVGMEHGNAHPGAAGEQALIQAYRNVDNFAN